MPELPEVESLAVFLRGHAAGHAIARADAASFSVLKTFDPPLASLKGQVHDQVQALVGGQVQELAMPADLGDHLAVEAGERRVERLQHRE